jgi:hypothetical protein
MRDNKVAFCLNDEDTDGNPWLPPQGKKSVYGSYDSQPYSMVGFKIKANPKKKVQEVLDYVFKPPPGKSKVGGGTWNSIEMIVNKKSMRANKFNEESVQSESEITSILLSESP